MPRKHTNKLPGRVPIGRTLWRLFLSGAVLAAVISGLYGLVVLDGRLKQVIVGQDRYHVRFADIDCDTPPGMPRDTFLAEVRYAADVPETLDLLAVDLQTRLAEAFRLHPWVEVVEHVEVSPPARITVRLRFRTPVLLVSTPDGQQRVVDANGRTLPPGVVPTGLPELVDLVSTADAETGQRWPQDVVNHALELLKAYKPQRLELTSTGWRLTRADGTILLVGR